MIVSGINIASHYSNTKQVFAHEANFKNKNTALHKAKRCKINKSNIKTASVLKLMQN